MNNDFFKYNPITDPWQGLLSGDAVHIATQGMLYFTLDIIDVNTGGVVDSNDPRVKDNDKDLRRRLCIKVWKDGIEYEECKLYTDLTISTDNIKLDIDYTQDKPKIHVEIIG